VAVPRSTRTQDASTAVALTAGFQSAFLALVILGGVGVVLALGLLGRPRGALREQLEAAPVPAD
jgi:hypothetical protein